MKPPVTTRRASITLFICCSLVFLSFAPLIPTGKTQGRSDFNERKGNPRPGKPEGTFKRLDEIKNETSVVRTRQAPTPSSIRSPKVPLEPWDGRRVGDPLPDQFRGQLPSRENEKIVNRGKPALAKLVRRAHVKSNSSAPFVVLDDTFIDNFYNIVMTGSYTPLSGEKPYWRDHLRVGYAKNQTALNLAAIEMGKTLLESSWYLNRNRTNSEYVSDLYWAYLMRAPDTSGWSFWTGVVASSGRENVRRAFEESGEFLTLMSTIVPNGSASSTPSSLISARTEPRNQPGGGLLTRDGTWSLLLISLPGRAGLDLGLALSYSSQVWTRSGPYLYFDEDNGMPSPGFQLGFPTIQRRVFNSQTNTLSYLLITSSGRRVELRQVGTSNLYEAADSSYLQLTDNGSTLLLRSTDGTQLTYQEANHAWRCNQVKDRNGNYLTIAIGSLGQITSVTDTLGRVLNFNYDTNVNLLSITQTWAGSTTHTWATFSWANKTMQSSFSSVVVIGPKNGTSLPVLDKVTANDGARFEFDYNNSLQVVGIRKYHDAGSPTLLRATTTFTYETPASDVPRLTDSRISALNWTGINGVPAEVVTQYSAAGNDTYVMTAPDGTSYKEIYGTGYQRGLVLTSEVWSGGVKQKWIETTWTQDNTSEPYELNPRVIETNTYDASNNRRRVTIEYKPQFGLPHAVTEYQADGTSGLRFTIYDYENDSAYLNRRIIGLPDLVHVYDGGWNLMSKTQYHYDWDFSGDLFQDTPAAATQHDRTNYGPSFIVGRGNLSQIIRYDVTDPSNANGTAIERKWRVNSTGSVLLERDHLGHQKQFAYGDDFSDSVNRNTFAYPTVLTDEDGNQSYTKYNFDFGATTRTQAPIPHASPTPNTTGAIQEMLYNDDGFLERITTTNNGAYRRFWYGPDYVASNSTVNTVADETYGIQYVDGVGRPFLSGSLNPWSTGGYKAQQTIYDQMGRKVKVSNPTEITGYWIPAGDDAAGWLYTQQTYNWQGKPLITTNPDNTTREASYSGCGCAGGEVVTITDEGTTIGLPANPVARKRQQRIYMDVVGRKVKTEIMNWDGAGSYGIVNNSVYSAVQYSYNALDQITNVRQYKGPVGSTYQDTVTTYDGHARPKTRKAPEQSVATVFEYNADDTVYQVKDGRLATKTFAYNNRRQVTGITYAAPQGSGIQVPSAVAFTYDAVGNRKSMTDELGVTNYNYDQLSRLTSESRNFTGVTGTFVISYGYNLANQLTSMSEPAQFGASFSYQHDAAGRLTTVTGSAFQPGVTTYASNIKYRAWGGLKEASYGNGRSISLTYDANLRPSTFTIPNVISKTYTYYADGALRFSNDHMDHTFDRFYSYDHAGRTQKALSGADARFEYNPYNPNPPAMPYEQTFGYDEIGHLNSVINLYWGASYPYSRDYTNNRSLGCSYDNDGNLLSDPDSGYTYDASGAVRSVGNAETLTNRTVDGNGKQIKTENSVYDSQTQTWSTPTIRFYLRSSVLNGQVLSEIEANGSKRRTFIFANGDALGWQAYDGAHPKVVWEHRDARGSSFYTTNSQGYIGIGGPIEEQPAELNPLGANVGLVGPPAPPPPSEGNSSYMPYPAFADAAKPGQTYTVDGIPVSRDVMAAFVDSQYQGVFGVLEYAARESIRPTGVISAPPHSSEGDFEPGRTSFTMSYVELMFSNAGWGTVSWFLNPGARKKSGCEKFVDHLVEHVERAGASVTQVALGAIMAAEAKYQLAPKAAKNELDFSGFKNELVDGEQNGWALVHVLGMAGVYLAGYKSEQERQFKEDHDQLKKGLDRQKMGFKTIPYPTPDDSDFPLDKYLAEKRAELADDKAGVAVGNILEFRIAGSYTKADAWSRIFNILCDVIR